MSIPRDKNGRFLKGVLSTTKPFKKGVVPLTAFKKGFTPWNKGLKGWRVDPFKGKKNPKLRNENHWNWKGGITLKNRLERKRIEYRLWRESVFARDNWTCQKCNKRGIKLHPHHIKSFAKFIELRFAIDNGITLCEKCHKKIHRHKKKVRC